MHPLSDATKHQRLLIVQRSALAGRALARCLASLFAQTVVTTCPRHAEALLTSPEAPATDLLCGQRFADDDPVGSQWIARWRSASTALGRVALVTAEPLREPVDGVDAVFGKPLDPALLQSFFGSVGDEELVAPARRRHRAPFTIEAHDDRQR